MQPVFHPNGLHSGAVVRPLHLTASKTPRVLIERLPRRHEQTPAMRQYSEGFEEYFNLIPRLAPNDPLLPVKTDIAGLVMKSVAAEIIAGRSDPLLRGYLLDAPGDGEFKRVILAVADPERCKEGSEILVAQWGKGFTSPVHGHAPGLLHEEILSGKMRVDLYWHTAEGVVRPLRTDIVGPGTLVSKYSPPDTRGLRMGLVHNFTAITPAVSLHFVPEHTRDGRDNKFTVEHFADFNTSSFEQITGEQGRLLRVGEVALVRSDNVPEYGDHFIVITGPVVLKAHGLRPTEVAIQAGPKASAVLDGFTPTGNTGLRLLKMDADTRDRFYEFHGIIASGQTVTFPQP